MLDLPLDPQVRIPKASEIVAAKIRRAIVTGQMAPGEYLPSEPKLIEMFQVSRPTIREAVRLLEFEDLISVERGARGGARVNPPSEAFVSRAVGVALQVRGASLGDLYQARMIIEPPAARLAAETRPKEAADALREHVAREYAAIETDIIIPVLSAEFHRLLMEQCGNRTLALLSIALRDLVARHQTLAHRNRAPEDPEAARKRSRIGVRSHERLADLIETGDGAGAEAHWRSHMQRAGEFFLDKLSHTSVVDILET